ncbi:MAG: glycosyltransferase [Dysgonamonadaceae bacterium]|jgi:glycosyltransferase involved in cell wall biosynthesis|nr:glycosyltransferase [Dysgonamonadaceae bacterium]
MEKMNERISVIIPVYNAEKTLPRCIASLHAQTYGNLELLFVDDCSTDNSLTVLNDYAVAAMNKAGVSIEILRHETNKGVAAARNTGLEAATGTYIYYVDADDWIEADALESVLKEAKQSEADIVGHEFYLAFGKNERYMKQQAFSTPEDALQKMMCGVLRWNLWLFLVRRSLYEDNRIRFVEGMNMGEDMAAMIKLFTCAKTVAFLGRPLYHYVQANAHSLTSIYSQEHIRQVAANVYEVEKYIGKGRLGEQLKPYIHFLKLNIKLPLLITDDETRYAQWLEWFSESNGYVMKNKLLPLRTRLIQWMAAKKGWAVLKLYYRFVIRFVYGVIYN